MVAPLSSTPGFKPLDNKPVPQEVGISAALEKQQELTPEYRMQSQPTPSDIPVVNQSLEATEEVPTEEVTTETNESKLQPQAEGADVQGFSLTPILESLRQDSEPDYTEVDAGSLGLEIENPRASNEELGGYQPVLSKIGREPTVSVSVDAADAKFGLKKSELPAVTDYIRQAAEARGIDPEVAVRVARSEGLAAGVWQSRYRKNGYREPSYGPFQLLKGGKGTGFPEGMGNQFQRQTGLDPADPKNIKKTIDFALDGAKKNGWSAWYGAAKVGVSRWQGISRG